MSDIFERIFGARFKHPGTMANPFLEDVRPYLKGFKELLQTESAASLAARMEAEPDRAGLYGGNTVRLRDAENWQTSWNYPEIDELRKLLYEAYSSEEHEERTQELWDGDREPLPR